MQACGSGYEIKMRRGSIGPMKPKKRSKETTEIEVKIKMSSRDLERVFDSFVKKDKGSLKHKFYPRFYFDTENLDLYNKNVSIRTQYKPGAHGKVGSYEQTVKFSLSKTTSEKDLMVRGEYKDFIDTSFPALGKISSVQAKRHFKSIKSSNLRHVFTAAVERRILLVPSKSPTTGKKGIVEVAFDIGNIFLAPPLAARLPISEIELEVKSGPDDIIKPIKDKILKMAPSAKVHTKAKVDLGMGLYLKNKP